MLSVDRWDSSAAGRLLSGRSPWLAGRFLVSDAAQSISPRSTFSEAADTRKGKPANHRQARSRSSWRPIRVDICLARPRPRAICAATVPFEQERGVAPPTRRDGGTHARDTTDGPDGVADSGRGADRRCAHLSTGARRWRRQSARPAGQGQGGDSAAQQEAGRHRQPTTGEWHTHTSGDQPSTTRARTSTCIADHPASRLADRLGAGCGSE